MIGLRNVEEKSSKRICCIFGAGEYYGDTVEIPDAELIIAADAGIAFLENNGIVPDIAVGDFDSFHNAVNAKQTLRLPVEKDDTDTLAAVREGLKRGCNTFYIYGGTGGRTAHTLANIQTLAFINERGAQAYLIGKNEIFTVIDKEISFDEKMRGYISVFAMGTARGVNISGLKYELSNAELTDSFPLGVSNEFIGKKSSISVNNGKLLIVYNQN